GAAGDRAGDGEPDPAADGLAAAAGGARRGVQRDQAPVPVGGAGARGAGLVAALRPGGVAERDDRVGPRALRRAFRGSRAEGRLTGGERPGPGPAPANSP